MSRPVTGGTAIETALPSGLRRRHRLFMAFSRWEMALARRLSPAGVLLVIGIAATGLLGADTKYSSVHQAFAVLAVLFVAAALQRLRRAPRLQAGRVLPPCATAGAAVSCRVRVRNLGTRPLRDLLVWDEPDPDWPSAAEYGAFRDPEDRKRNAVDRWIGFHRWRALLETRRRARPTLTALPPLPPGGWAEVDVPLLPLRRGVLRFSRLTVYRPDLLGILRFPQHLPEPGRLAVLPRRFAVPQPDLAGSARLHAGGAALALAVGDSPEFMSVREYRPGDPLRRIHWKSTARRGEPVVREMQEERFVRHALVLDTFGPGGAAFEDAVSLAASLAVRLPGRESLLDLLFVGERAWCFTVGRGVGQVAAILEILAGTAPCLGRPFAELERLVLERTHLMSGAALVLLDWDAPRQDLAARLRGRGIAAQVYVVRPAGAPVELDPGPLGGAASRLKVVRAGRVAKDLAAGPAPVGAA